MRSRIPLLSVTDGVWCFRQSSYACCSYAVVDDDGKPAVCVCPGNRIPLTENVAAQLNSLRQRVLADPWPLLG
ncbi:MAG: hypothetical protein QOD58_4714 [Mycobacterium sp.]|jgi:hypothetical protein|nr:hypothetical protein [Mycobacterium sp.]